METAAELTTTPGNPRCRIAAAAAPIRVALRLRPILGSDKLAGEKDRIPCVSVVHQGQDVRGEVTVHLKDQWTSRSECYNLDSSFDQDDGVRQIFLREVCAMIPAVFHGANTSVFAYGATGSGKTYTMQGTEEEPGLIRLSMSRILDLCKDRHCSVEISYYEIYLDRCYDLLEPKGKEIVALNDKDGRVQLKGLAWVSVSSMDEFRRVFSAGNQRRKVAATGVNDVSSRSHAVLAIAVSNEGLKGKLSLIDLAGNEDNRRTLNEGIRLQESNQINKSLFALSNVIHALNNNQQRIPYRESKLTRILQDSLGGTSRALMIACVNQTSYQEAVRTVSLAARTRQIVDPTSRKEVTPLEKVDMEAKLRAWLESKGKTKSSYKTTKTRPSPLLAKTPASNCSKTSRLHSTSQGISRKEGRRLFDPEAPNLNHMEETMPLELETPRTLLEEDELNEHDELEDSGLNNPSEIESRLARNIDGALDSNKENYPCHQANGGDEAGESNVCYKLEEIQRNVGEVLTPISIEKLKSNENSDDLLGALSPKIMIKDLTSDNGKAQVYGTPLDKFNSSSSNLKESLMQEYISFLNVASRDELLQLKGIGQKRAEYILQLRENTPEPIKSLSDLEKIGLSSKQVHGLFSSAARVVFT